MGLMEHAYGQSSLGKLFADCAPEEAAAGFSPDRRSVRIHGHTTTIRLEKAFWQVLEQLAAEENMSLTALITMVHDHCPQMDFKNLASCLRVVCLRTTRANRDLQ